MRLASLLLAVFALGACGRAATPTPPRGADEAATSSVASHDAGEVAAPVRCAEGTIRVTLRVGTGTPSDIAPTVTTRCMPADEAARMQASGSWSCGGATGESLQCIARVPQARR